MTSQEQGPGPAVTDQEREQALAYAIESAHRGIPAFPIAIGWNTANQRTRKRPLTPHGHRDATTDIRIIREQFVRASLQPGLVYGYGQVPGRAGYVVIDADRHEVAKDGVAYLDEVLAFPSDTYIVDTAAHGEHRWYRKRDVNARISCRSPWESHGIDIRADSGWVVGAGTRTPWGSWIARQGPPDVSECLLLPELAWQALVKAGDTTSGSSSASRQLYVPSIHDSLLPAETVAAISLVRAEGGEVRAFRTRSDGREAYLDITCDGHGTSATLGHVGPGVLYVFSSGWPGRESHRAYDLVSESRAGGGLSTQAWSHERCEETRNAFPALDWRALWDDEPGEEWLLEPLIPKGRGIAIYSPAKAGKSLLLLEVSVRTSLGQGMFGNQGDGKLHHVLYVDFENDPVYDIRSRLQSMGFGPDDLDHLHYLSFPSLAGLDTARGGDELLGAAMAYKAEVVVVDTASRTISGPENDNDTWLAWFRHTGFRLKQAGIAFVRLDHTGKDESKGQRGASAKSSDVDAVWRLSSGATDVIVLRCEQRRFVIPEMYLPLRREKTPHLRHVLDVGAVARSRERLVNACIADLQRLGIDPNVGQNKAYPALKAAGIQDHSARTVLDAQKERRKRAADGCDAALSQRSDIARRRLDEEAPDTALLARSPQESKGMHA